MKHIHTFESFLNESLNEGLSNFHAFLDDSNIDPKTIQQFYVEPRDIYIKINSGDDTKDMKDLTEVRNKIKKLIPSSARIYLEPWYVERDGMGPGSKKKKGPNSVYQYTALQFVYNSDAVEPGYYVEFAHKFDTNILSK